jgi:Flp pilus assembly pilin Flp
VIVWHHELLRILQPGCVKKGRSLVYLTSIFLRLSKDNSGGLAAEHALLIVFIAIAASLGMVALGPGISDYFDAVTRLVPDTEANPPCPFGGCPENP